MITYTSDAHDLTIHAQISTRGARVLASLGFTSEHERNILAKRVSDRVRLDQFVKSRAQALRLLNASVINEGLALADGPCVTTTKTDSIEELP